MDGGGGGGGGGEELTAQETALYDRQIRVWGVDAQRRLSKSHVLVSGMTGTAVELCKNIVLAGVGSLTLMDDRSVTENAIKANFLIPPDETKWKEGSVAELCCDSLKEFNPMVHVSVEKGDLSKLEEEFFDKFDAVVLSSCSLAIKKEINNKCRRRPKRIAFYTVDCRGSCGEIFIDLQDYSYAQKKPDGTTECDMKYLSFEGAIGLPWQSLPRKVTKLYFAMRVIENFEESSGRRPGELSVSDLADVLILQKKLCEAQSFGETYIPVNLLERLLIAGSDEYPPVCAILGGILGQEVIKGLSGKGDPIKNFFFFDTIDGKGIIEDISTATPTT